MKKILKKYKLIDSFNFEIETNKNEFIEKLKKEVAPGNGLFSSLFEAFSNSNKVFKGTVNYNSFEIRKIQRMFDKTAMLAKAKGKFTQEREKLIFDIEINGVSNIMKVGLFFIIAFYLIFISISLSNIGNNETPIFFYLFIPLHGMFMLGIPIFMARKSVKNLKMNIEKEFFFIAKR